MQTPAINNTNSQMPQDITDKYSSISFIQQLGQAQLYESKMNKRKIDKEQHP